MQSQPPFHPIIFNYLREPMDRKTSPPVHEGSFPPNNHMALGGYTVGFDCRTGFNLGRMIGKAAGWRWRY